MHASTASFDSLLTKIRPPTYKFTRKHEKENFTVNYQLLEVKDCVMRAKLLQAKSSSMKDALAVYFHLITDLQWQCDRLKHLPYYQKLSNWTKSCDLLKLPLDITAQRKGKSLQSSLPTILGG